MSDNTGIYYRVKRYESGGYCAMAKKEPWITDGDPLREPGPLWFAIADTAEKAMKLLRDDGFD